MTSREDEILSVSEIIDLRQLREFLRREQIPSSWPRSDNAMDLERHLRVVDKLLKTLTEQ